MPLVYRSRNGLCYYSNLYFTHTFINKQKILKNNLSFVSWKKKENIKQSQMCMQSLQLSERFASPVL